MAKDAQGAHLKAGGKAPTPQPAHVKVPDNPYLAAAQEAQRNQRGVSIICGVLVVIAIAITGVMSIVHAADDEPETSLETPLEMSLGPALLPLDDIARRLPSTQAVTLQHGNIRDMSGLGTLPDLEEVYVLAEQEDDVRALFEGTEVQIHVTEN